ncbi:MAG: 4-hydroxy-tetrahydrodipicolinate reductase [Actinomycetota bacterium]|nr:4-hydroxy-tetrahydrodipicolinate reductase [Actinomycetota bacterium]
MLRVGVLGAAGRMGREVCRAVLADPDLELVATVDPGAASPPAASPPAASPPAASEGPDRPPLVGTAVEDLAGARAEVAVDFTVADGAVANMRWCAEHGVHAVVGTTGISDADIEELERLFEHSDANAVLAANFALGAVLMMRFCEIAAPFMDGAEVVELHHDGKLDAPSGTALKTAEVIAGALVSSGGGPLPPDRTERTVLEGSRGADGPGGVRIHSVRLPGLVAHQEVLFGALGQSLSIRHDSYDRSSFMPGVLLAVKAVAERPGLTLGLGPLLGI